MDTFGVRVQKFYSNGLWSQGLRYLPKSHKWFMTARPALLTEISQMVVSEIQLTLVISNSMGPWTKFESTVVRLKRSYENTGSVVCLTTKGRQLGAKFWRAKTSIACPYSRNDFKHIRCFCCVFFLSVKSFNLVERLITSRYLFLCVWICLSILFMFFSCCIVIKLHPSWRIFLCAILFITINGVFLLFNKV